MFQKKIYRIVFCILLCSSCASFSNVQPLEKGELTFGVEMTAGASYTNDSGENLFSAQFAPTCSVYYGLNDRFTLHGGISPLSLSLDTGILIGIYDGTQAHPGISFDIGLNLSPGFWGPLLDPYAGINAYFQKKYGLYHIGIIAFYLPGSENISFAALLKTGWEVNTGKTIFCPALAVGTDFSEPYVFVVASLGLKWKKAQK